MMNWKRTALTILLSGATASGLAGQSLELASRVHPSQVSDTASGADFDNSSPSLYPAWSLPSASADGRYVVFISRATNLVPGQREVDQGRDVFLRDLATGVTTLVSRSLDSPTRPGSGDSSEAVISADGRFVAFVSEATNLVPGEQGTGGLFLYDRVTETTVHVASGGFGSILQPVISADGRYIAFVSEANDLVPGQQGFFWPNVFLYDRVEKTFRLVSHSLTSPTTSGGGRSGAPAISADGRFVAFYSVAEDLAPTQSPEDDLFLYDRTTGGILTIGPGEVAAISADGRYIAAASRQITYLFERETLLKTVLRDSFVETDPFFWTPLAISADGRFTAFVSNDGDLVPGQQGGTSAGLFLYDRDLRSFILASRRHGSPTASGFGVNAVSLSADGRFAAFATRDWNLVAGQMDNQTSWDVFLFDRNAGTTTLVSHASSAATTAGNGGSASPVVSADGSRVFFVSGAGNLVDGLKDLNSGLDVFVHETATGSTGVVSRRAPEMPSATPAGWSTASDISADGRFVAFQSLATHLIAGQTDANGLADVFLYDRATQATILVSRARGSVTRTANGHSLRPQVSADGRFVVFLSNATDLVSGAASQEESYDVFLFDRVAATTVRVGRRQAFLDPEHSAPSPQPRISPDGRWVVFDSYAPNVIPGQQDQGLTRMADVFLWDRITGSTILVSRSRAGAMVTGNSDSFGPLLSDDGRYVAFISRATDLIPGQTGNGELDLFLFDRTTGKTALVSHAPGSATASGTIDEFAASDDDPISMSADGRYIAFVSQGDLDSGSPRVGEGVYLHDRTSGVNRWIATARNPTISANGRFLTLVSGHPLVPGFDPDGYGQLYLYDRIAQTFTLVTRPAVANGRAANGDTLSAALSADGRYVAFASRATDLVPGQAGFFPLQDPSRVFLFDRIAGTTALISRPQDLHSRRESWNPLLSASGQQLAFTSTDALVEGDLNGEPDAYLFSATGPVSGGPTPLPPCKLLDTRRRADRPALRSNTRRTVRAAGVCGVPATAKSVSVTVTALQATGKGNLRLYAGNDTVTSSGILRFEKKTTRSATFNVPLATNGDGTLAVLPFVAGKGTVQVIVEVNGYSE